MTIYDSLLDDPALPAGTPRQVAQSILDHYGILGKPRFIRLEDDSWCYEINVKHAILKLKEHHIECGDKIYGYNDRSFYIKLQTTLKDFAQSVLDHYNIRGKPQLIQDLGWPKGWVKDHYVIHIKSLPVVFKENCIEFNGHTFEYCEYQELYDELDGIQEPKFWYWR